MPRIEPLIGDPRVAAGQLIDLLHELARAGAPEGADSADSADADVAGSKSAAHCRAGARGAAQLPGAARAQSDGCRCCLRSCCNTRRCAPTPSRLPTSRCVGAGADAPSRRGAAERSGAAPRAHGAAARAASTQGCSAARWCSSVTSWSTARCAGASSGSGRASGRLKTAGPLKDIRGNCHVHQGIGNQRADPPADRAVSGHGGGARCRHRRLGDRRHLPYPWSGRRALWRDDRVSGRLCLVWH